MKGPDGSEYLGARQQIVKVGATKGDLVAVESGVKPGEVVVTAGVFKLRNGAHVQINNSVQPSANPAPKPANT
jgi:membrane fusion protein (multidrug efflux system)